MHTACGHHSHTAAQVHARVSAHRRHHTRRCHAPIVLRQIRAIAQGFGTRSERAPPVVMTSSRAAPQQQPRPPTVSGGGIISPLERPTPARKPRNIPMCARMCVCARMRARPRTRCCRCEPRPLWRPWECRHQPRRRPRGCSMVATHIVARRQRCAPPPLACSVLVGAAAWGGGGGRVIGGAS